MSVALRRLVVAIIGLLAGVAVWPLAEVLLFFQGRFPSYLVFNLVVGAVFGAAVGGMLGSGEGIGSSVGRRIWMGAVTGLVVGAVGGAFGFLVGQGALFVASEALMTSRARFEQQALPLSRILGWTVVGVFVGMVEGVRARSGRKLVAGALGGIVAGVIGGALLEAARRYLPAVEWARLAAFALFGLLLGVALGLVERRIAIGRLRVLNGDRRGKEFLVNQRRLSIGSRPGNAICLPGYNGVAERHAELRMRNRQLLLRAVDSAAPVLVNEQPVQEHALKYEDVILLGDARLYYRYA